MPSIVYDSKGSEGGKHDVHELIIVVTGLVILLPRYYGYSLNQPTITTTKRLMYNNNMISSINLKIIIIIKVVLLGISIIFLLLFIS
jgi:hypothetical protein